MRAVLAWIALPLVAQTPEALANAERAFARRAEVAGTRSAFLVYLADDALVFNPKAQLGKPLHANRPDDGSTLIWRPSYVEVSGSGDFGISTGPYAWTPRGKGQSEVFGHFLSVWAQRQGQWQVILDVGIPHEKVLLPTLQGRHSTAPPLPPDQAKRTLIATEESLDQLAVTVPYPTALREFGAMDLRIYRPGFPPAPGNYQQACRFLPTRLTWVRRGILMAPSGDLACTWGESDEGASGKDGQPKASRSSAIRIWRRERGMEWRMIVDLALPIPD